ncbi:hypothetical protein AMTRI_Chr08g202140 [Amborella trichopoda]
MGAKVGASLPWSQIVGASPQTLTISLLDKKSRSCPSCYSSSSSSGSYRFGNGGEKALVFTYTHGFDLPFLSGSMKLPRTQSCEKRKDPRTRRLHRRALSSNLQSFPHEDGEEEYLKRLRELAYRYHLSDDAEEEQEEEENPVSSRDNIFAEPSGSVSEPHLSNPGLFPPPPWLDIQPNWPPTISASLERKANSVDLPMSLRIIKRKQWHERGLSLSLDSGFREASCSVKKAFSSMVFMIRELQSYTLQMRELLFYQDLQGILTKVQKEMNASFVWLFQQVFSCTPTLMVYLMILLANFTVYSMARNTAIAEVLPSHQTPRTSIVVAEERKSRDVFSSIRPDSSRFFSVSDSGKSFSSEVGSGSGNGGARKPPLVGGDEDSGDFSGKVSGDSRVDISGLLSGEVSGEDRAWQSVVEEAARMEGRDEVLDHETAEGLVAPVRVVLEPEDEVDRFRTRLVYQMAIAKDPDNPLLLSNYAQFLYLVVHDHNRAEAYFKHAVRISPPDSEALSRYAHFLWRVRNDIAAAEETFLEAIEADPGNSHHAGNYAHFLWNTGGEDTCYPLGGEA